MEKFTQLYRAIRLSTSLSLSSPPRLLTLRGRQALASSGYKEIANPNGLFRLASLDQPCVHQVFYDHVRRPPVEIIAIS
jgi:hypothetical protein